MIFADQIKATPVDNYNGGQRGLLFEFYAQDLESGLFTEDDGLVYFGFEIENIETGNKRAFYANYEGKVDGIISDGVDYDQVDKFTLFYEYGSTAFGAYSSQLDEGIYKPIGVNAYNNHEYYSGIDEGGFLSSFRFAVDKTAPFLTIQDTNLPVPDNRHVDIGEDDLITIQFNVQDALSEVSEIKAVFESPTGAQTRTIIIEPSNLTSEDQKVTDNIFRKHLPFRCQCRGGSSGYVEGGQWSIKSLLLKIV